MKCRRRVYSGFLIIEIFLLIIGEGAAVCNRKPQGASGDRSMVDENFQILVSGNPPAYAPNQVYNISLSCANNLKFLSFTLTVEGEEGVFMPPSESDAFGRFEIIDAAETRFSLSCENMIENTNTNSKSRIDVAWVAPENPQVGCVLIKAAVLQHRSVWFIDDGFLTKRMCPEEMDVISGQTPLVATCCACDEAKYEIRMERRWSRNTHAKDYPSEAWRTRLGQIVGASHTGEYRFWDYGSLASPGLAELAQHGYTQLLEEEIKANSKDGSIRTIIKAPGVPYRGNVVSSTLASARVDPTHHVVSLVSKIEPSPDWILGIAGMELCLENCTWIEKKELNLYPWDAGTDRGPSYMSPDQPQIPPDVVRRISSTSPSDVRSPFFDESGAPMKPLATLFIERKKLYERTCEFEENVPRECATHPWNRWSECSTRCGRGERSRMRYFKYPRLAENFRCEVELMQNETCFGRQCGSDANEENDNSQSSAECQLTEWSEWSACSNRCGKGVQTSSRDYTNPYARDKCQSNNPVKLRRSMSCQGNDCGGEIQRNFGTAYDEGGGESEGDHFGSIEPSEPNGDNLPDEGYRPLPPAVPTSPPDRYVNRNYGRNDFNRRPQLFEENEEQPENRDFGQFNQPYESPGNRRRPGGFQRPGYPPNGENGELPSVVEGIDSTQYTEVQEYCVEKPIVSNRPCRKKPVIVSNYWFYDANDGLCKLFTSDNCDENKNKFGSMQTCEETCHLPMQNLAGAQDGDNNWNNPYNGMEETPSSGRWNEQRNSQRPNQRWNAEEDQEANQVNGDWNGGFGEPMSHIRRTGAKGRHQQHLPPETQQRNPDRRREGLQNQGKRWQSLSESPSQSAEGNKVFNRNRSSISPHHSRYAGEINSNVEENMWISKFGRPQSQTKAFGGEHSKKKKRSKQQKQKVDAFGGHILPREVHRYPKSYRKSVRRNPYEKSKSLSREHKQRHSRKKHPQEFLDYY